MWEQVRHLWSLQDVVPGCVDVDGSLERIRMSPIFFTNFLLLIYNILHDTGFFATFSLLLLMPCPKKFIQEIRRELSTYTQQFDKDVADTAFSLATETLKKTRFTSRVYFLSRCLRRKVIPTGFKGKLSRQ